MKNVRYNSAANARQSVRHRIAAQDIDDNGTNDFTPTYDVMGNLADDDEDYEFTYDAWGRLVGMCDTLTQATVAEYRYNGLGHRFAEHVDTDEDGDVDGDDDWVYLHYGVDWQVLATFLGADSSPTSQVVSHVAGDDGLGFASHLDAVVLRDRDTTGNGVLNERIYYSGNGKASVELVLSPAGRPREYVRYFSSRLPFGLPAGDVDSSGGTDSSDITAIQGLIDSSSYDSLADLDSDGDVDVSDKSIAENDYDGDTAGVGVLSVEGINNVITGSGRPYLVGGRIADYRYRGLDVARGQWLQRDPMGYADGSNLYSFVRSNPGRFVDPYGLLAEEEDGLSIKDLLHCKAGDPKAGPGGTMDVSDPNENVSTFQAPGTTMVCGKEWRFQIRIHKLIKDQWGNCFSGSGACYFAFLGESRIEFKNQAGQWGKIPAKGFNCDSRQGAEYNACYKDWHGVPHPHCEAGPPAKFPEWSGTCFGLSCLNGGSSGNLTQHKKKFIAIVTECPKFHVENLTVKPKNGGSLSVSITFPCGCIL